MFCSVVVSVFNLVLMLLVVDYAAVCASRVNLQSGESVLLLGDSMVHYGVGSNNGFIPKIAKILEDHGIRAVDIKTAFTLDSSLESAHLKLLEFIDRTNSNINNPLSTGNIPVAVNLPPQPRNLQQSTNGFPETVVICLGTDYVQSSSQDTNRNIFLDDYVTTIKSMVADLRSKTLAKNIVLAGPSILGEKYDYTNRFDSVLEELAAEAENLVDVLIEEQEESLKLSREYEEQQKSLSRQPQTPGQGVPNIAQISLMSSPGMNRTISFEFVDLFFATLKRLERVNYENLPASILTFDGQHFNDNGNDFIAAQFANKLCSRCADTWQSFLDNEEDDKHTPQHARLNPHFFSKHAHLEEQEVLEVPISTVHSEL
jgi:hypothetical protein